MRKFNFVPCLGVKMIVCLFESRCNNSTLLAESLRSFLDESKETLFEGTITLVFQETGSTQIDTKIAFRILFEYSKKDAFLRKRDTCCVPSRHHVTASKTKLFHLVTVLVKRSTGLFVLHLLKKVLTLSLNLRAKCTA